MHTSDFDFELPPERIAQAPLEPRDASKLLHVSRTTGTTAHRIFRELPSLLRRGDLLVLNDTRVLPARLLGHKTASGGKVELLLVRPAADVATSEALRARAEGTVWVCLGQASKPLRPGAALTFEAGLTAEVVESRGGGEFLVRFTSSMSSFEQALQNAGKLPLPPYITRAPTEGDAERYNTVYAREVGSVAAPTAGLHFTDAVFSALDAAGVARGFVTLDVGPGTFLPVREGEVSAHHMHAERYTVPTATAEQVRATKRDGGRVIAVGTTVVRTLESMVGDDGQLRAGHGSTSIFITPGFSFRAIDALLTNFHLPKSTLVMLVSAFLGRERTLAAYRDAIRAEYRFFSYGDAMFID